MPFTDDTGTSMLDDVTPAAITTGPTGMFTVCQ